MFLSAVQGMIPFVVIRFIKHSQDQGSDGVLERRRNYGRPIITLCSVILSACDLVNHLIFAHEDLNYLECFGRTKQGEATV